MSNTDPGLGHSVHVPRPPQRRRPAPPRVRVPRGHTPRPPRAFDPFAPVTNKDIAGAAAQYGPVLNDGQIQSQASRDAQAQIKPVLDALVSDINRREGAAQTNLAGATRGYVDAAREYAPAVGQAYGHAEQSQAATDAAVAQALAGGGTSLAEGLSAKLAAAGLPGDPAAQVGAAGTGAANAALASGSAELGRLIGSGVAEQGYGAKLPGIAANTGLQRAADLGGRYAGELSTRTADLTSRVPALIANLVSALTSRNESRRSEKASAVSHEKDRALNTAVFRKEYGIKDYQARTDRAKATATARGKDNSNLVAAARVDATNASTTERARHDKAGEAQKRKAAAADKQKTHSTVDVDASRSRGILIGKDGHPILKYKVKNGRRVKGSGRTIPYKPPKTSGKSSGTAPPAGFPTGKGK